MDREELDKQLEQNGRKIQLNKDDKSSGRKKLFALAAALLIIGGAGGYFMGNFSIVPKGSTAASSSQMFQQTPDKNKELPAVRNTAIVLIRLFRLSKKLARQLSGLRQKCMTGIYSTAASR